MSKLPNNLPSASPFSQNLSAVFQSRLGAPEYSFQSLNRSLHRQLPHWLQRSLRLQAPAPYHSFGPVVLQEQSQLGSKNLRLLGKQSPSVSIRGHSYNQGLQSVVAHPSQPPAP